MVAPRATVVAPRCHGGAGGCHGDEDCTATVVAVAFTAMSEGCILDGVGPNFDAKSVDAKLP